MYYNEVVEVIEAYSARRTCWENQYIKKDQETGEIFIVRTESFDNTMIFARSKYQPSHSDMTNDDWEIMQ